MAHTVHTDVQIFLGAFNLSGDANSFSESRSQGTPEDSTFGNSFRQRLPGVRDVSFALAGFSDFDENEVDSQLHAGFGVTPATPLLWAPDGTVRGDPCFFGRIRRGSYGAGGAFGDAAKFDLAGSIATGVWHRGTLLDPHREVTAVGNSTPVQIGPQSATQTLFGHLAITRFDGIDGTGDTDSVRIRASLWVTGNPAFFRGRERRRGATSERGGVNTNGGATGA